MQFSTADKLRLSLEIAGHIVFFDRKKIRPGDDFDRIIHEEIRYCDMLIFLISPESLAEGAYARTELAFAQEIWPVPIGHVLPVMAAAVPIKDIPNYLNRISILRPEGDLVAEVVAEVRDIATGWKPEKHTVLAQARELEAAQETIRELRIKRRLAELDQDYRDKHGHKAGGIAKSCGMIVFTLFAIVFLSFWALLASSLLSNFIENYSQLCWIFPPFVSIVLVIRIIVNFIAYRSYLAERKRILRGELERETDVHD